MSKKREIPEHLKKLIKDVGMTMDEATWETRGTPVIYHDALERIADHIGITFSKPDIIENNSEKGLVAMCVEGTDGDKIAWSIGESSPSNNKNAYCYAMAEKRAKDRVILKLIGASGFVYSDQEADEFRNENRNLSDSTNEEPKPAGSKETFSIESCSGEVKKADTMNTVAEVFMTFIPECKEVDKLRSFWVQNKDALDTLKERDKELFDKVEIKFLDTAKLLKGEK